MRSSRVQRSRFWGGCTPVHGKSTSHSRTAKPRRSPHQFVGHRSSPVWVGGLGNRFSHALTVVASPSSFDGFGRVRWVDRFVPGLRQYVLSKYCRCKGACAHFEVGLVVGTISSGRLPRQVPVWASNIAMRVVVVRQLGGLTFPAMSSACPKVSSQGPVILLSLPPLATVTMMWE